MARKLIQWATVRDYYEGLTGISRKTAIRNVSLKFHVTEHTIRKRLRDEKWILGKFAQNVIDFRAPSAELGGRVATTQRDHLRLINGAIAGIGGSLEACIKNDLREAAAGASAMCKLIELHRTIQPPTATMLADAAIRSGIRPDDFIEALKSQWRMRG